MKVGDKVEVTPEHNSVWTGVGEVLKVYPENNFGPETANVYMLTGQCAGMTGGFATCDLVPVQPEAYLCLYEDGTYCAHEGSLDEVPDDVVRVWKPGKALTRQTIWKE